MAEGNQASSGELPAAFCWSKFGVEAGQSAGQILARKESERVTNDGVFTWGIGNSLGASLRALLKNEPSPHVFFTPMLSAPRACDVSPEAVVAWTSGTGLDGIRRPLPSGSLVTSAASSATPSRAHYALICMTSEPISNAPRGLRLNASGLVNLRSGAPLGSSQVTAIVRNCEPSSHKDGRYEVVVVAEIVAPYLVRLDDPVLLSSEMRHLANEDPSLVAELVASRTESYAGHHASPELPFYDSLVG